VRDAGAPELKGRLIFLRPCLQTSEAAFGQEVNTLRRIEGALAGASSIRKHWRPSMSPRRGM